MATVMPGSQREIVVLVHGLWMKGWCMAWLAWRLRRAGFATHCVSYRSMGADLHENAVFLQDCLAELPHGAVHLVGHSLGCIVIRALFHYFPRQRPGRIVMLAPPNRGSLAAAQMAESSIGRALLGKAIRDVLRNVPRQWPAPEREIGIVSGTTPVGLGRLITTLPTPNDGVLTVTETALSGCQAQLLLPVAHSGIILSETVARAVARFIRVGRFP